jgi:hypothetical protein
MSLRFASVPVPSPAPAPRSTSPLLALLMSATLAACGGGGGGGGAPSGNTETAQSNTPPPSPPVPVPGEQAVAIDGLLASPQAFHFKVDEQLDTEIGLQAATGGSTFSAWNPVAGNALFSAGLKVNFFGRAEGCVQGANNGPVGAGNDALLPAVAAATGVATTTTAVTRWAPSGSYAPCTGDAWSRQGPNMVVLNPQDSAQGGMGLYTRTGPDSEGSTSLMRPFDALGQNGAGANAFINGTFVTVREDWRNTAHKPWLGTGPSLPVARVVATQSVQAFQVGTEVIANQAVQAKQQVTVGFINPICMAEGASSTRPCQLSYLFNTAIQRAGVDDWSTVSWFQNGKVWFDPAQGGTPIIDLPVRPAGTTVVDEASGLGLYESRGNATQHATFQDFNFDMRISFAQLQNVLRIVTARNLSISPASVTDAQLATQWGVAWNDRNAWALLSASSAQEVHNPISNRSALIGGNFKQLYVGPQS